MVLHDWSRLRSQAAATWSAWTQLGRAAQPGEIVDQRSLDRLFGDVLQLLDVAQADDPATSPATLAEIAGGLDRADELVLETMRLPAATWEPKLREVHRELDGVLKKLRQANVGEEQSARGSVDADVLRLYEQDASKQISIMWAYLFVSLALTGAFVFIVVLVLRGDRVSDVDVWVVLGSLAALGLLTVAALREAQDCRRSALETQRLRRQLQMLDSYLRPLPETAQHLLRATLTQRLFPRLLEDENPMREEEVFPNTTDLLVSISASYKDARRRQKQAESQANARAGQERTPGLPGVGPD